MTAPEIWINQARQGGFSRHILPPAGSCGEGPAIAGFYADGAGGSVRVGDWVFTAPPIIGSFLSSGGPFDEPFFRNSLFFLAGSALGQDNFVVETWFKMTAPEVYGLPRVITWAHETTGNGVDVFMNTQDDGYPVAPAPPPSLNLYTTGDEYYHIVKTMPPFEWQHLVIQRKNGVIEAWLHGAKITAVWFDGDYSTDPDFGAATMWRIGLLGSSSGDYGQTRVRVGEAPFSGSTISVPTAPFFP